MKYNMVSVSKPRLICLDPDQDIAVLVSKGLVLYLKCKNHACFTKYNNARSSNISKYLNYVVRHEISYPHGECVSGVRPVNTLAQIAVAHRRWCEKELKNNKTATLHGGQKKSGTHTHTNQFYGRFPWVSKFTPMVFQDNPCWPFSPQLKCINSQTSDRGIDSTEFPPQLARYR
jgi:hypothetical protein